MKFYYNKSTNGQIIVLINLIIGFVVYFLISGHPIYYAFLIDLIFIIYLAFFICERKKYYIQSCDTQITFTIINIEKRVEKIIIKYSDIVEVTLNKSKSILIILTNKEEYILNSFHLSQIKTEEIFENLEIKKISN